MARYIDADKLIEAIEKNIEPYWTWDCVKFDEAMEAVSNAPTADVVEVKHGEWSLHPDGSGTCNLCGRTQKSVWDFDNAQAYCGKCGAKMDLKEGAEI